MANQPVVLSCPICGTRLQVAQAVNRFACAKCGNELVVHRETGIIYLEPLTNNSADVRASVGGAPTPAKKKQGCFTTLYRGAIFIILAFVVLFILGLILRSFTTRTNVANLPLATQTALAAQNIGSTALAVNNADTSKQTTVAPTQTPAKVAVLVATSTQTSTAGPTSTPAPTGTPTMPPTVTSTPLPTSTPTQTHTPTSTPLPTDTPLPTATLAPAEALKASLVKALGASNRDVERISEVEVNDKFINVKWAINDNLTLHLLKFGARQDVVKLLATIRASGLPYTAINLSGTFASTDKFGKTSEIKFVFLTYNQATVEQINWQDKSFVDVLLQETIYDIADTRSVNPELDGND